MIAKIYILPKKGILDPKGKAISNSLKSLGFYEVEEVRFGKYMEIKMDGIAEDKARERIKEMCDRLLANNLIEDYKFEIEL